MRSVRCKLILYPAVEADFTEQLVQFQSTSIFYLVPPTLSGSDLALSNPNAVRKMFNFSTDERLYVCFHNLHKFGVVAFDATISAILTRDER